VETSNKIVRGSILGAVAGLIVAVLVIAGTTFFFYCPCERIPGGWLLGDEVTDPVSDWSFANDVRLCKIQVNALVPHSVNLNCMSTGGKLYLSCASCEGKYWSTAAINDSGARIRINDQVYPVKISRVLDPKILDEAWLARATKLGRPTKPRAEGWWSFNLVSR
jgi:hypothetical protein